MNEDDLRDENFFIEEASNTAELMLAIARINATARYRPATEAADLEQCSKLMERVVVSVTKMAAAIERSLNEARNEATQGEQGGEELTGEAAMKAP